MTDTAKLRAGPLALLDATAKYFPAVRIFRLRNVRSWRTFISCPERSAAHPAQPAGAVGNKMKSALIAAADPSMLVTPALADSKVYQCTVIAKVAKVSMGMRQSGADLPVIIAALSKELEGDQLAGAIEILTAAYNEPLYSTEQAKQRAVNEFSSKMFLACMEVEA